MQQKYLGGNPFQLIVSGSDMTTPHWMADNINYEYQMDHYRINTLVKTKPLEKYGLEI